MKKQTFECRSRNLFKLQRLVNKDGRQGALGASHALNTEQKQFPLHFHLMSSIPVLLSLTGRDHMIWSDDLLERRPSGRNVHLVPLANEP